MTTDSDAKKAAILKMLRRFGSQAARLTEEQIEDYYEAVDEMSVEAVQQSCKELRDGLVLRNNEFMPTPVELTINTRRHDRPIMKMVMVYNGLLDMNFGHGRVDMRGLTPDEQDRLIEHGGRTPDGRNAAFLSLDQKRASLKALAPAVNIEAPLATPKLKGV